MHLNIKQYILERYNPIKQPEQTLEVVFDNSNEQMQEQRAWENGQLRCPVEYPFACTALKLVPVKKAETLVAENELQAKRIMEITLDLQNYNLEYEAGDTIGILPSNPIEEVWNLLEVLNIVDKAHNKCTVEVSPTCTKKSAKVPPHIPLLTTPLELLRDCLNIRAVIKKQFLRILAECCSVPDERNFLNCLSSKEASSHYNTLILERGLILKDLLQLCPSCKPTLAMLVENLPRLLPRPYSIANSPFASTHEIKIICSILSHTPGVTTNMLQNIANSIRQNPESLPKVAMYLRQPNKFRFTLDEAICGQILIAIGTGLAPFVGFLDHKQNLSKNYPGLKMGETWLFAGATCEESLLHRNRFLRMQSQGLINRYFESFSRLPDASYAYVQDQLKANSGDFIEFLLRPNTIVYVCADGAEISRSIEAAIGECLMQELALPEKEVGKMLKEFRLRGKYREDLWI